MPRFLRRVAVSGGCALALFIGSEAVAIASPSAANQTSETVRQFRSQIGQCTAIKHAQAAKRGLTLAEAKSCAPNASILVSDRDVIKSAGIYIAPSHGGYVFRTLATGLQTPAGSRDVAAASGWEDWWTDGSYTAPWGNWYMKIENIWVRWADYNGDPDAYVDVPGSTISAWYCSWATGECKNFSTNQYWNPDVWNGYWDGSATFVAAAVLGGWSVRIWCSGNVNTWEHGIGVQCGYG